MSGLEKLIQQHCPKGVEWKRLGEVCEILDGQRKPISKGERKVGEYPYYGANGIQDYVADYIFDGTYILVGEDGSVITPQGHPIVNWATGKIWVNNHAHILAEKDGVLLRYLYYFIQTIDIQSLVHGNIPKLTQGDLKALSIPVPPLMVQEEIVRILDKFTELQAELQAELLARKQQYEYYRDKLLAFDELGGDGIEVQWRRLGEICIVNRGVVISKDYIKDNPGLYPVYSSQTENNGCLGCISTFAYDGEYLTWTTDGANAGTVFYRTGKFNITNVCGLLKVKDKMVLTKYLFYILTIEAPKYVNKGMGNAKLMSNVMSSIIIPIPPLTEQRRIVEILDKFDELVNGLTSGLPAEIKMRQQQYEYYRDKIFGSLQ